MHDNTQDVISALGPPLGTLYKPKLSSNTLLEYRDYFHNYPHLGMDVQYSAKTHTVIKIILHTNIPGYVK